MHTYLHLYKTQKNSTTMQETKKLRENIFSTYNIIISIINYHNIIELYKFVRKNQKNGQNIWTKNSQRNVFNKHDSIIIK